MNVLLSTPENLKNFTEMFKLPKLLMKKCENIRSVKNFIIEQIFRGLCSSGKGGPKQVNNLLNLIKLNQKSEVKN